MNIKALMRIDAGFAVFQEGEFATLPDADALDLIRNGAAEPADRRARRLAAEDAEAVAKKAAADLIPTPAALAEHARRRAIQVNNPTINRKQV